MAVFLVECPTGISSWPNASQYFYQLSGRKYKIIVIEFADDAEIDGMVNIAKNRSLIHIDLDCMLNWVSHSSG